MRVLSLKKREEPPSARCLSRSMFERSGDDVPKARRAHKLLYPLTGEERPPPRLTRTHQDKRSSHNITQSSHAWNTCNRRQEQLTEVLRLLSPMRRRNDDSVLLAMRRHFRWRRLRYGVRRHFRWSRRPTAEMGLNGHDSWQSLLTNRPEEEERVVDDWCG